MIFDHYQEDFAVGRLYPDLKRMKEVSIKIATKVAEEAYKWAIVVVVVVVIVIVIVEKKTKGWDGFHISGARGQGGSHKESALQPQLWGGNKSTKDLVLLDIDGAIGPC